MKQIIIVFFGLSLLILTSCSTQQRVVYRNCDCNSVNFDFRWNNPYLGWNNPYLGWNNPYLGWNNPYLGWNNPYLGWNSYSFGVIPRYYTYPNLVQPLQPSRYERRQSISPRPSRTQQNQSVIQERRINPTQNQRNPQPSRVDNIYPQRYQPRGVQNSVPSRTQTPSRVQPQQNKTISTQPTRSRVGNRGN
jgi:hypothetical protein